MGSPGGVGKDGARLIEKGLGQHVIHPVFRAVQRKEGVAVPFVPLQTGLVHQQVPDGDLPLGFTGQLGKPGFDGGVQAVNQTLLQGQTDQGAGKAFGAGVKRENAFLTVAVLVVLVHNHPIPNREDRIYTGPCKGGVEGFQGGRIYAVVLRQTGFPLKDNRLRRFRLWFRFRAGRLRDRGNFRSGGGSFGRESWGREGAFCRNRGGTGTALGGCASGKSGEKQPCAE